MKSQEVVDAINSAMNNLDIAIETCEDAISPDELSKLCNVLDELVEIKTAILENSLAEDIN